MVYLSRVRTSHQRRKLATPVFFFSSLIPSLSYNGFLCLAFFFCSFLLFSSIPLPARKKALLSLHSPHSTLSSSSPLFPHLFKENKKPTLCSSTPSALLPPPRHCLRNEPLSLSALYPLLSFLPRSLHLSSNGEETRLLLSSERRG